MQVESGSVETLGSRIVQNVSRVLVGKETEVELCVIALLSRGHILIEDVPGVGKTMLAKSLARSLGCSFERLQFTPDLLPSDVTGVNIYSPSTQQFEFRQGPVFTQILLADEINRATPKTQSALLEAMEERQVTVDGTTYPLPMPFVVMATQNPVEFAGTFPLPEAQVDRFLMRINLGYLDVAHEVQVLDRFQRNSPIDELEAVASAEEMQAGQRAVQELYVDDQLKEYIARVTHRTRSHTDIALGASSRGSLGLFRASQARAALEGRDFVTPDDVKALVHPVLAHRLVLKANAELRGLTAEKVLNQILQGEPVPPPSVVSRFGRRVAS
jgi:MoxR-like ATPase